MLVAAGILLMKDLEMLYTSAALMNVSPTIEPHPPFQNVFISLPLTRAMPNYPEPNNELRFLGFLLSPEPYQNKA